VKKIDYLSKNKMKQILRNYLISQGWSTEITRRITHEIDIVANRDDMRWVIAVRGGESRDFVESFDSILGSAVHIMEDPNKKYSVALPDTMPFRRLWERLPVLAKTRTSITALFVSESGKVTEAG
jgi:hypothetical protein